MKTLTSDCLPWAASQRPGGAACLNDPMAKDSAGNKKKDLLEKIGVLTVCDLNTATNPRQGFAAKSFNVAKLKLPSFLPPTVPPHVVTVNLATLACICAVIIMTLRKNQALTLCAHVV